MFLFFINIRLTLCFFIIILLIGVLENFIVVIFITLFGLIFLTIIIVIKLLINYNYIIVLVVIVIVVIDIVVATLFYFILSTIISIHIFIHNFKILKFINLFLFNLVE